MWLALVRQVDGVRSRCLKFLIVKRGLNSLENYGNFSLDNSVGLA